MISIIRGREKQKQNENKQKTSSEIYITDWWLPVTTSVGGVEEKVEGGQKV